MSASSYLTTAIKERGAKYITSRSIVERKARIGVSLYNPQTSGKLLSTYISKLSKLNYSKIEIQVADTLHRFNLVWKKEVTLSEAHKISLQDGEKWLSKNRKFLMDENIAADIHLTRWDDWLQHPYFKKYYTLICDLFDTDKIFHERIHSDVYQYFKRTLEEMEEEKIKLSIRYLIEELAVAGLTNNVDPAIEAYPGPQLTSQEYLSQNCCSWLPKEPSQYGYINLKE